MLKLFNDKNFIIKKVFINNTLALKGFDNIYLIINYKKFNLDVEFNNNLIEINLLKIISSKIKSVYRFSFSFINVISLIVERYLLIYIFLIANINIKRR